jgi:hypothetical protein
MIAAHIGEEPGCMADTEPEILQCGRWGDPSYVFSDGEEEQLGKFIASRIDFAMADLPTGRVRLRLGQRVHRRLRTREFNGLVELALCIADEMDATNLWEGDDVEKAWYDFLDRLANLTFERKTAKRSSSLRAWANGVVLEETAPRRQYEEPVGPEPTPEERRAELHASVRGQLGRATAAVLKSLLPPLPAAFTGIDNEREEVQAIADKYASQLDSLPFNEWADFAAWVADMLESVLDERDRGAEKDYRSGFLLQESLCLLIELGKNAFPPFGALPLRDEVARLRVWPHPLTARGVA